MLKKIYKFLDNFLTRICREITKREDIMKKVKLDIKDIIIKLQKEIIFIYSTYTDSIQFTQDDKSELNKLERKLSNL